MVVGVERFSVVALFVALVAGEAGFRLAADVADVDLELLTPVPLLIAVLGLA